MSKYYVYILTNSQRKVLYIGVTNNLPRRLSEHYEDNITAKKSFAGKYNCYNLVYFEEFSRIKDAILREKVIKKWRREKKNNLITTLNPDWKFLNSQIS